MSFELVTEFSEHFNVRTRTEPAVRVPEAKLRFGLIEEEFKELLDAYLDVDIVEVLDALGDIQYVVFGAALVFGMADAVESKVRVIMDNGQLDSDLANADLSTNPLLDPEGQQIVLDTLRKAILTNDVNRAASELATILYLTELAGIYLDLDVADAVDAIHVSNMTKLGEDGKPVYRESDNKVLKGPNYKTPTADLELQLFGE